MKTFLSLSTLALILATPCAFAQGTIAFNNSSANRVYVGNEPAAAILGVANYGPAVFVPAGNTTLRLGLYYSLTETGHYVQVGEAASFSAVAAGRFSGSNIAVPGVPGGSSAWFQVRVWEASYGADYEAAVSAGFVNGRFSVMGSSSRMQITTGSLTPAVLSSSLESFGVYHPVPEPSTIAVGLLGLAGWLAVRRRS